MLNHTLIPEINWVGGTCAYNHLVPTKPIKVQRSQKGTHIVFHRGLCLTLDDRRWADLARARGRIVRRCGSMSGPARRAQRSTPTARPAPGAATRRAARAPSLCPPAGGSPRATRGGWPAPIQSHLRSSNCGMPTACSPSPEVTCGSSRCRWPRCRRRSPTARRRSPRAC